MQTYLYITFHFNVLITIAIRHHIVFVRAVLTGKHGTLVRRAPGWQGAPGRSGKELVVINNVYFAWQRLCNDDMTS